MRDTGNQNDFHAFTAGFHRRGRSAGALGVLLLVLSSCVHPTGFCSTSYDCSDDQICDERAGQCVDPPPVCASDKDCPNGRICADLSQCLPAAIDLQAIQISPMDTTIAQGTQLPFVATGLYTDGSTHALTRLDAWDSSSPTVVSVTPQGVASGLAPGSARITARLGNRSGATSLQVTSAVLTASGGTLCALGAGGIEGEALAGGVAVDSNGNMVLLGQFYGPPDLGGGSLPAGLCLAKYTSTCGHIWSRCFAGSYNGKIYTSSSGVAVDSKDNIYLTQTFSGTVNVGGAALASAGEDILLAKFDPAGTHKWSAKYGGSGSQEVHGLAIDGADNLVLTGSTDGSVDVNMGGGILVKTSGNRDLLVAKYNSAGAFQWARRQTGPSAYLAQSSAITVDASNNVVVTGGARGSVDLGSGTAQGLTGNAYFVARYTSSGAYGWSLLDRAGDPQSVATLASGDPIVAGAEARLLLARYDAVTRMARWSKPSINASARAIVRDGTDQLIVAGTTDGGADFGGGLLSAPNGGAFVVKYDAVGVHKWSRVYRDSAYAAAMAVGRDRQIAVTGHFFGPTLDTGAGILTLPPRAISRVFILRLAP